MKNKFWGLLFILAAVYILFGSTELFEGIGLGTIILTAIFAGMLIKGLMNLSFGGILFPSAFLSIIWDKQLGIEDLTPWPVLFAALLGTIGLNMIFGKSKNHIKIDKKIIKFNNERTNYATIDRESGQYVTANVKFGGLEKYIESEDLRRVDLTAHFGGAEIYLNNAKIPSGEAIVTLDCKCSGVDIYVPKEWNVINKVDVTMGAVSLNGKSTGESGINLILIGNASLCGVDIKYV